MPRSAAPETAATPADIVIPDCCNIGVVLRTLIGVNAAAFVAVLVRAGGWKSAVFEFVEASVVVEMACLWSLFILCGLRQVAQRRSGGKDAPAWAQRAVTVLVPAAVTGLVVHLFSLGSGVAGEVEKGIVVGGAAGILFQHYFELRKRAFSPALVEARLQALQARIRPHFLFNSLNAALSLVRTEPRQAENTLEDLADLFRVLMSDPRSMTSLDNEIRLCRQYLSIEKVRLGERMQVSWDMAGVDDEVLRRAQVPVLLLQPLIENAVHYGVEPALAPVPVRIVVARSLDKIEITVTNPFHTNAPGGPGNHMALENIRERLKLLYDVEAQLTTAVAGDVFEARLRFPYVKGAA